ncbi:MAG: DUF2735 domain-containing protein [Bradyrhizobiaceae bacterium]|nr:MAG: DUF2735 domain-containing protein [Bradyrhizobiaceae bacterium]
MNSSLNQGPAKIYQFPKQVRSTTTDLSKRVEAPTFGGSWYHEAAIREAVGGYGAREVAAPRSAVILPLNFSRQ